MAGHTAGQSGQSQQEGGDCFKARQVKGWKSHTCPAAAADADTVAAAGAAGVDDPAAAATAALLAALFRDLPLRTRVRTKQRQQQLAAAQPVAHCDVLCFRTVAGTNTVHARA